MKRILLTALLIAGHLLVQTGFADDSTTQAEMTERVTALYRDPNHSKKCALVFNEVRKSLKPGMTSKEISMALGDSPWLENTISDEILILGGWIPVDLNPERAFAMHVYPNADKWSNYVIYFSLSCPKNFKLNMSLNEFLQGKVSSKKVRLHQFALCYPGKTQSDKGRIEVVRNNK